MSFYTRVDTALQRVSEFFTSSYPGAQTSPNGVRPTTLPSSLFERTAQTFGDPDLDPPLGTSFAGNPVYRSRDTLQEFVPTHPGEYHGCRTSEQDSGIGCRRASGRSARRPTSASTWTSTPRAARRSARSITSRGTHQAHQERQPRRPAPPDPAGLGGQGPRPHPPEQGPHRGREPVEARLNIGETALRMERVVS